MIKIFSYTFLVISALAFISAIWASFAFPTLYAILAQTIIGIVAAIISGVVAASAIQIGEKEGEK